VFPYKDENPTLRTPVVTIALIGLNVAAWVLLQGIGAPRALAESVCELGLVPAAITGLAEPGARFPVAPNVVCVLDGTEGWRTVLSSMFLHGGWLHLIGNMWFLWVFGNNVEDSMGRVRFLAFYLLGGIAAAAAQILADPGSLVPMVGASGAIGAVMGGYIALYPQVRVHVLVFLGFFFFRIRVPAFLMLGLWILSQFAGQATAVAAQGGTAYWAHIGGFLAGLLLIQVFQDRELVAMHRAVNRRLYA
jgi:membrane associated rhomboid family serine protease